MDLRDQRSLRNARGTRDYDSLPPPPPPHPCIRQCHVCTCVSDNALSRVDPSLFFVINSSVYRISSNPLSCTCRHCELVDVSVREIFLEHSINSDWNRKLFPFAGTILYRGKKKVTSEISKQNFFLIGYSLSLFIKLIVEERERDGELNK